MNPLPTTDSEWLEEVRSAFANASEVQVIAGLAGASMDPDSLAVLAPDLCAKFRGLPVSGRKFAVAKEAALSSYAANYESHAQAFAFPEVAFAFCYVASHYGYDLITEEETTRILDYFIDHAERLLTPADPEERQDSHGVSEEPDPEVDELLRLTAAFCQAHLNPEYETLCAKLVREACGQGSSRFSSGTPASRAAGVVHAICTTNFAFDKSQKPHVRSPQIAQFFKVSPTTVSQKSKILRDEFRIRHWDPEFSTVDMQQRNPLRLLGMA
ncbi:MAG: hypothetical protein RIS76_819 [Verrucomicrobiota bacterium]|jgi:hypothetical protein